MPRIDLYKKYVDNLVNYLAGKGDDIIRKAASTKGTSNRKRNQLDAYGWCVYYEGKKKKQGFLTPSKTAEEPHNDWKNKGYGRTFGRDDVINFFEDYTPESNGFILVCVNAVFYTTIQENPNSRRAQKKYRIISQIAGDMQNLSEQFKGSKIYTTL